MFSNFFVSSIVVFCSLSFSSIVLADENIMREHCIVEIASNNPYCFIENNNNGRINFLGAEKDYFALSTSNIIANLNIEFDIISNDDYALLKLSENILKFVYKYELNEEIVVSQTIDARGSITCEGIEGCVASVVGGAIVGAGSVNFPHPAGRVIGAIGGALAGAGSGCHVSCKTNEGESTTKSNNPPSNGGGSRGGYGPKHRPNPELKNIRKY